MSNPLKPLLDRLPQPFQSRYFVASVLFCVWLLFFDKHNVLTQIELSNTLTELKRKKIFYQENIEHIWEDKRDIEVNKEKFAREHYFMKKRQEDVYIIEDK